MAQGQPFRAQLHLWRVPVYNEESKKIQKQYNFFPATRRMVLGRDPRQQVQFFFLAAGNQP